MGSRGRTGSMCTNRCFLQHKCDRIRRPGFLMSDYVLNLPDDFDDYEWELVAKGCFSEARVDVGGKVYELNFYDPFRLGQEIEDALARNAVFVEKNLVVIPSVTRAEMENAADFIVRSNRLAFLAPQA